MKSIDTYDFKGKRAIIRVDFNVPLDENFSVTDSTRIRAAIPTIKKVLAGGGSVILMSHLGRPKKNNDDKYSLRHIVGEVEKLLGHKVAFAGDSWGEKAAEMAAALKPGDVMMLENLRFYAEEEGKPRGLADDASDDDKAAAKKAVKASQKEFTQRLASYADVYINDAFGTAHRAHASTALIADYFPNDKMFGYVMENELKAIDGVMENPGRPFMAILGGAKVSTKIVIIEKLMEKVDSLIISGGMTYTFASAQGQDVGDSMDEKDMHPLALEILAKAKAKGVKLYFSPDALCGDRFAADANMKECDVDSIPKGWEGMDIGAKGRSLFRRGDQGPEDHPVERPRGSVRVRQVRERHPRHCRRNSRSYRQGCLLAHRRRRQRGRNQQVRPRRQSVLQLHRRRRTARIYRRQGVAGRGRNKEIICREKHPSFALPRLRSTQNRDTFDDKC